jgi:hypothetical protein
VTFRPHGNRNVDRSNRLRIASAGWTRDALAPELAALAAEGRVVALIGSLDRATWPHARAGFFGVAKQIDALLGECGISES